MRNARIWTAGLLVLSLAGCGTKVSLDAGSMGGGRAAIYENEGRPAKSIGMGMANKAARGFVDTLTGWIEWPMQTWKGYEHGVSFIKNEAGSKTVGVLKGLILSGPGYAIGRTGSGLGELFGFWTANRPDNNGIGSTLDAEFVWDEGKAYSMFEPSLEEGLKPYGRKFVHGVANAVGGICEIPSQIKKGANGTGGANVGTGIVKGFWFFLSREWVGWGDTFGGFLFPNHNDTVGRGWEEKWAWSALTDAPAKK